MRVTFNWGKSAKGDNGCNKPFFGYNWGYWIPNFHHNKGNLFKKQVFDASLSWLIFWVGITFWPYHIKNENADQVASEEPRR